MFKNLSIIILFVCLLVGAQKYMSLHQENVALQKENNQLLFNIDHEKRRADDFSNKFNKVSSQ